MAATAVAVALAVVLACGSAYLTTRHAVWLSVDESLRHVSDGLGPDDQVAGSSFEIVFANGTIDPNSGLPVNHRILRIAARQTPPQFQTVVAGTAIYREFIRPLPRGSELNCAQGTCLTRANAALIFGADVSGQVHQLKVLQRRLVVVALFGVLLAALLGYLAARAAMRPLVRVTETIEEIAQTTDVARRLPEEQTTDELDRLRSAFNTLLTSVDDAQREQRQLVMDASHELRTPLTSLRTNAQVLRQTDRLSTEDIGQITTDMVAQVDELAALVTDLGELARGERSEGAIERVALDEMLDELVETARTHARTKDVTVHLESAGAGVVLARRDRLHRALTNLIGNAIKFAPRSGTVAITVHDGVVVIEDDGPGVAPEERSRVFDRFWRSPSARALPGSGLGLAIVAQVAHELRATVTVDTSNAFGGARFTLAIPLAPTTG